MACTVESSGLLKSFFLWISSRTIKYCFNFVKFAPILKTIKIGKWIEMVTIHTVFLKFHVWFVNLFFRFLFVYCCVRVINHLFSKCIWFIQKGFFYDQLMGHNHRMLRHYSELAHISSGSNRYQVNFENVQFFISITNLKWSWKCSTIFVDSQCT